MVSPAAPAPSFSLSPASRAFLLQHIDPVAPVDFDYGINMFEMPSSTKTVEAATEAFTYAEMGFPTGSHDGVRPSRK